jgi:hypothetical protein
MKAAGTTSGIASSPKYQSPPVIQTDSAYLRLQAEVKR